MKHSLALLVALAFAGSAQSAALAAPGYRVVHRYVLGGSGGWDYLTLDTQGHRLFIARDDRVMVVSPDSGQLLGEIHGIKHAHGVALSADGRAAYVTNGAGDMVSVVDPTTFAVTGTIPVSGHDPDAIILDPASGHLFVMNGHSNTLSIIDPALGKEMATITVPGNPEFGASDARGHVYVNLEDAGKLAEVDSTTDRLLHTWSLAPCKGPTGLSLDQANHRLFSVCANGWMVVTDALSGAQVAKVRIGTHPDAVAFDPLRHRVLTTTGGNGELNVIRQVDEDHYRLLEHPKTMMGARTMALDPRNGDVFTVSAVRYGRQVTVAGFTLLELAPTR